MAKISIGMPVYNCERTVATSIQSLLNQSFHDFELIIADNSSTDQTTNICRDFARIDSRIRYVKHSKNIGGDPNYLYVLNAAESDYFMWAAAGDYWSDDWIEVNYNFLSAQGEDFVASTSPNCFDYNVEKISERISYGLCGSKYERFASFLSSAWNSHAIFYSLMRTSVIRNCAFVGEAFFAGDWAINMFLLSKGQIHRSKSGLFVFAVDGWSSLPATQWKAFDRWELILPLYRFSFITLKLSRKMRFSEFMHVFYLVVKLNISALHMRSVFYINRIIMALRS